MCTTIISTNSQAYTLSTDIYVPDSNTWQSFWQSLWQMGKSKSPKDGSVPQKHLHSRLSYLYQASKYLDEAASEQGPEASGAPENFERSDASPRPEAKQSLYLLSQLRSVSQKTQVRLSQELKRSLCRRCNAHLIPGRTSCEEIENFSRGGAKPWADILSITCLTCGAKKKYPVGARRQTKTSQT